MKADVGCLMRNNRGQGIKSSAGMIGLVVPVAAQFWFIFYGLKLTWEKGDVKHVVECDSEEAVNQVNNPDPHFCLANLVVLIKNLKNEVWDSCVIQHVPNSSNAAATALAEFAIDGDGGVNELSDVLAFMTSILTADRA